MPTVPCSQTLAMTPQPTPQYGQVVRVMAPLIWLFISRILLIPVVAGIAYEYIRFTAKHMDNPIIRAMIVPNLMLQHLTTREPDSGMLEVAIESFKTMRKAEQDFIA